MPCLLRIAFLLVVLALPSQAKDILLRNERIQTPAKVKGAALAQAVGAPTEGLYLVQFENPIVDAQRAALAGMNVELALSVPKDAFVARLRGTDLARLRALNYVRWVGPMRPEHKIDRRLVGLKEKKAVSLLVAPKTRVDELAILRRTVPGIRRQSTTAAGTIMHGVVDAKQLNALASSAATLWIEPAAEMKLFDEIASEIVDGEWDGPGAFVPELGFDGAGVGVAVADSGLMDGTEAGMHPDLVGRVGAFFQYGTLTDAADEHSHGTHVAGIVAGNGAAGEADEEGFWFGLGVAPGAQLITQRIFDGLGGYQAPDSFEQLTRDAVQAGAVVGSNSWGDDTQGRYDISAMEFDALVRDADGTAPGDQPYILEFSAGNSGPGERTIGSPAVAKNVIATGAAQNNRFEFLIYSDGQETMADFSSRGPCEDGRFKPDVVAPGTWIASLQSSSATDEYAWQAISSLYQFQGGTSQAGPHASGAAAIFVQYYRQLHGGATPSPALVKAALINTAIDMDADGGTETVPNNDEGWGRIDLTGLIASDSTFEFVDQTETLIQGQVFEKRVIVSDALLPLRITLAYTDFPGSPLTIPALVNDLDLEVIAPDGALYAGNQFFDGEAAPEPFGRDAVNNVEAVYLNVPVSGEYIVRVRARSIAQDSRRDTLATDQDFALVVSGRLPPEGHAVISFDRRAYSAPATVGLKLIDFDLAGAQGAEISIASTTETTPLAVHLTASGTIGVFTGAVTTARGPATADGLLQVAHGDEITATYPDTAPVETVRAMRRADLIPPMISGVSSVNRFGNQIVTWTTDEAATSMVRYGKNGAIDQTISSPIARENHAINLTNLVVGQEYKFIVVSFDEAGNGTTNDNGGQRYSFIAQPASTVLLVDAYQHGPNDEGPFIPVTEYTVALDRTGVSYEVWDVATLGQPALANLLPFRVVIWRINDSFYDDTTLSVSQQAMLESYVKRDGAVMIASMELLTRLGDVPFRRDFLQVDGFIVTNDPFDDCPTCDQDHGLPVLEGIPADSIGAGVEIALNYDFYPVFELEPFLPNIGPDLADTFTPTANASTIFIDQESGRTTGIRWPRDPKTPGRIVFLSFPLDGIPLEGPTPNNRVHILRSVLAYLAPGVNGLGALSFDRPAYSIPDQAMIEIADSDLAGKGKTEAHIYSNTDPAGITVNLVETTRQGVFRAAITLAPARATPKPGLLRTAHGETIVAEYLDASANSTTHISAIIDAIAPMVTGVTSVADFEYAIIGWNTDQPADSLVQYGESTFLGRTAYSTELTLEHQSTIAGLKIDQLYFFQVVSRDAAGNTVIDDNNGKYYTFRTRTPRHAPWSDDLEAPTTDWSVETLEDSETAWARGTPENGLDTAGHSGANVWGTNLRNVVATYAETALVSPAILITGGNRATLHFWHNFDFTPESTFESATLQIVTNSQTQATEIGIYDGASAGWEKVDIDLTPYIGKVVQFVWFYQLLDFEDNGTLHPGWMLDDISVTVQTEQRGTLIVHTDLSQATYTIGGPTPATSQGRSYTNSAAIGGNYTVTFNPVRFYTTPAPQTQTLTGGGTVIIEGKYEFADANQNGISDEWETEYFGSAGEHSGSLDSDSDGATDYAEFMAGTSPIDAGSCLRFEAPVMFADGRFQLGWPTVPGRTYRIVGATDATTWTAYTPWMRANSIRMTQMIPPLPAAPGYFFQVEVRP